MLSTGIFLVCVLLSQHTTPTSSFPSSSEPQQDCAAILKASGATDGFAHSVVHGIHSITLEDLQKFKADVTENNRVPTINPDLMSNVPILPHAARSWTNRLDDTTLFESDGMRAVDRVLSHMDDNDYDLRNSGTLKRLVHAVHMLDAYSSALVEYRKLVSNLSPNSPVCHCALDVENNGVFENLRLVALQTREPVLMYQKSLLPDNQTAKLAYDPCCVHSNATNGEMFGGRGESELPQLESQAAWQIWRKKLSKMNADGNFDLALYLYCALNN